MNLNIGWLEVLLIDGAALVTIVSFVFLFFKSKQDKLEMRFQRNEDKINDLSVACLRREEFHTCLEPVRGDIADIRRRIDDFINNIRNKK